MFSYRLKHALERVGLLRPAYWINQRIRIATVARASASTAVDELSDGLPLPPARLLVAIGGNTSAAAYLHGGLRIAAAITEALGRQGVDLATLAAVLDFGCGSGRVIRRFRSIAPTVQLHGCDYDARLVEWCRHHLPFASFRENNLAPPLPYSEAQFDVVYSFSVFTHLTEALQLAWLQELRRVIKPGGHLVFTVQGDGALQQLTAEETSALQRGELVVRYGSVAGSNLCASFHPVSYLEGTMARGWTFVETFDSEVGQRFVVFRR